MSARPTGLALAAALIALSAGAVATVVAILLVRGVLT
jgi:hypothetical protein